MVGGGGGGGCKKPNWFKTRCGASVAKNESENTAAQMPIFHPAAVAASGEASMKLRQKQGRHVLIWPAARRLVESCPQRGWQYRGGLDEFLV